MKTRVPGPLSKQINPERIAWSGKFEGTNAWDIDGNRFLDLTSAGGALPFGYVDEPSVPLSRCLPEGSEYQCYHYQADFLSDKEVIYVGLRIDSAFEESENILSIELNDLANLDGSTVDVLCLKSECLDELSVKKVKSWCRHFQVQLMIDERDIGFYRSGNPFAYLAAEPEFILSSVALGKFEKVDVCYTNQSFAAESATSLQIEGSYYKSDLSRTIKLQSAEMSELLKDMVEGKDIISHGSFHRIILESKDEASRVCHGLLQRGIIVSKVGESVAILPSLYLALGEIIFAANHIKAVVANVHEMEVPWMTDEIR